MRKKPEVTFVGQGPNQTAFVAALARAHARNLSIDMAFDYAESYCARVAVTGKLGEKLARMLRVHPLRLYSRCGRANLNARWNGKNGKGDAFNAEEGKAAAERLLSNKDGNFVLLGRAVARCFGLGDADFCSVAKVGPRQFLILPHPSGINAWWNNPANERKASRALRKFVNLKP